MGMRFRKLRKWDPPAKIPTLIYFAQLFEEMLFEFSLDTYKPSVMHTGLLCSEALATIREIEAGNIKLPNIYHVTAELCTNFEKDLVAQALSPLPPSSFFPALRNPKAPLRELKNVLELLAVQLSPRGYREKNEELLQASITSGASLSEVRQLSRSYVTTLIATGFSTSFLSEQAKDFFHYGASRIAGPENLADFFRLFPKERLKFAVIFRVDPIFEHVASAIEGLRVKVVKSMPPEINLSQFKDFYDPESGALFAIVSEVSARETFAAREAAEQLLELSATLLTLFHHKENPSWSSECIVVDNNAKLYKRIPAPTNAMHKCADLLQAVASKRLQLFVSDFSLERDSFSKFVRSAQLHAMALASNAEENQILNLWIALESLVPSETKLDDVSNIEHIVHSLIPFLNIGYVERLVNNLVKNLLAWNPIVARKAFRAAPGKKFVDKLVRILVLPEFAHARILLEDSFRDFHLLRSRFEYFKAMLGAPSTVVSALDAHKVRLEWQIRRIYRTRNIIVHSGQTPGYTKALIEHTHDYLDTVLSLLVRLASKPKSIDSVGQGFKFVELRYARYYESLSVKGLVFDATNIDALVFCR